MIGIGWRRTVAILLCLCSGTALFTLGPQAASAQPSAQLNAKPTVIPTLQTWEAGSGTFEIAPSSRILATKELQGLAKQFSEDLTAIAGVESPISDETVLKPGDLVLTLDPNLSSASGGQRFTEEGYRLEITGQSVRLSAPTSKGLFYGTRTVLQILMQSPNRLKLPVGSIVDWPSYAERGFMLDVGRRFFTPAFVRDYIKMMSWYKLNTFQLHLNDNEIAPANHDFTKSYTGFRLASTDPALAGLASTDGAYTKSDWDSFEDLAETHAMNIVPELGGPGHAGAIVRWKPSIGLNGGNSDHLDLANPDATQTMKELYKQFVPWFRSPDLHIGTDEYPRQYATAYKTYFNEIASYVRALGKSPRAWGSATAMQGNADGYDRDVAITAWNDGWYSMKSALADGFSFVNTRDADLYVVPFADYYHGNGLNNSELYAKWLPNTDSSGKALVPAGSPQGAMFAVWNDLVNRRYTEQDVHQLVKDSFAVIAQKTWKSDVPEQSYAQFSQASSAISSGPGLSLIGNQDKISGELGFQANVIASSANVNDQPANLTDGSSLSKWSTSQNSAALTIDLGQNKIVGSIQTEWSAQASASYEIEVSDDGRFWQHAKQHENLTGAGIDTVQIGGFSARYLRLSNIVSAAGNGLAAWRISVFAPEDLARGAAVTASGTEPGTSFSPEQALDGSSATRWSADYSANPWIQVDLGAEKLFDSVRLNWENASATAYAVESSVDGTTWRKIVTKTDGAAGSRDDVLSFTATSGRYVRMTVTGKSVSPYLSLYDLEIRSATRPAIVLSAALDNEPPATTATFTSAPKLTLNAMSTLPGNKATELSINGGPFLPYDSPVSINGSGEVALEYRTSIGHQSATGHGTIRVETVAPGPFSATIIGQTPSAVESGKDFELNITGANPGSTVSAELHSFPVQLGTALVGDNGAAVIHTKLAATTQPGNHSLVISGTDTRRSPQSLTVAVVVTAPIATPVQSAAAAPSAAGPDAIEPQELASTGVLGLPPLIFLILGILSAGAGILIGGGISAKKVRQARRLKT